jgi:hypothetical protein
VLYLNTEIIYTKTFHAVNLLPEVVCDITTVYVWVLKNSFFRLYQLQEVKINSHMETQPAVHMHNVIKSNYTVTKCVTSQHIAG